jgi:hypothetical protein
MFQR